MPDENSSNRPVLYGPDRKPITPSGSPDDQYRQPQNARETSRRGQILRFLIYPLIVAIVGLAAKAAVDAYMAARDAEDRREQARADATPDLLVEYIIGPRADLYHLNGEFDTPLPREIEDFRIIHSIGDWAPGNLTIAIDPVDVECSSSTCKGLTSRQIEDSRRTIWLLVQNNGSKNLQDVTFEWSIVDSEPVETSDTFGMLRAAKGTVIEETVADLPAGEGLMTPLASVLHLPALAQEWTVPLGQVRDPVSLTYRLAGESEDRNWLIREPAEAVNSGAYDTEGDGRIIGGG